MNSIKLAISATLAAYAFSFATQYEAELATLSGGSKSVSNQNASGGAYVDMQEGNITFNEVTVDNAGKYTLKFHYKAGEYKANYLIVNGATAGTLDFNASSDWTDVETAVTLKAGANTIALEKFWGWISVDYIDVSSYESTPYNLSKVPVTEGATESAKKLYSFLLENFGKKTISGIMTGDMDAYTVGSDFKTHTDVNEIFEKSGKYPALIGIDFLFANGINANDSWYKGYTQKGISLAKDLWNQGGIPAFTWHWKDPLHKVDAFYIQSAAGDGEFTDFDFSKAFKAGTTEWNTESPEYKGIIDDIDEIAVHFLDLQNEGVAAIFRPLHEAGGKWFWWNINSGEQFIALYRLVYDRMVNFNGVKNLIWVYNPEGSVVTDWDPGKEYYDILSIDIYNNANDHSSNASSFEKYKNASNSSKILALSENGPIPDIENMVADEAIWSFWMPWYGSWGGNFPSKTSNEVWKKNMEDSRIITIEDMPGWKNFEGTEALISNQKYLTGSQSIKLFDFNGVFIGKYENITSIPRGKFVMQVIQDGKISNKVYIKN